MGFITTWPEKTVIIDLLLEDPARTKEKKNLKKMRKFLY